MGLIDIVILAIIGIGAFRGFLRGFIHQLASIAGWIAGFLAAKAFYLIVAEKLALCIHDASEPALQIIAFVAVWIITSLLFMLAASFFTRIAEKLSIGSFNRLLGLLFGAAKWALIVGLLINALDSIDTDSNLIKQTKKEKSMLYYPVKNIVGSFLPTVKEITNKYIII
ncbi:MAG: CvpA family protein [Mediterranea sp.]|jgi:membrane protein required for colicin V production|nr:CvpA family protein [Mediterranea sp.]